MYMLVKDYADDILAVSCDELYIDATSNVAGETRESALALARRIRDAIFAETQCCASVGIGPNMLLARLATNKAKPNGEFYLDTHGFNDSLHEFHVTDLPGVGHTTASKLDRMGLRTCRELYNTPKVLLCSTMGEKTGETYVVLHFCQSASYSRTGIVCTEQMISLLMRILAFAYARLSNFCNVQ
jgi:DNA repair protein REV1